GAGGYARPLIGPSRATLSTPGRAAVKVAVCPEVEIPSLPRPLRQGEINRRELPPNTFSPSYPCPALTRPLNPTGVASAPLRTPWRPIPPALRTRGSQFAQKSPGPELRLVSPPFGPLPCAARDHAHRRILSGSFGVPGVRLAADLHGDRSAVWRERPG